MHYTRSRELLTSGFQPNPQEEPITGPLAELLQAAKEKREQSTRQRNQRMSAQLRAPQTTSRTYFLAELEVCGNAVLAARSAGCTVTEVRAWRASDPMFERDYVLALASHLRALTRMIQEIADQHQSPQVRHAARQLLASENRHVGCDGRLDARSWRDSLASFAHSLGMDLAWWEPADQGQEARDSSRAGEHTAA